MTFTNKQLADLADGYAKAYLLTVTMYLGVSNFQSAMSIVIPRSRSALSLSNTHAEMIAINTRYRSVTICYLPYLKEPLPNSAASFSNFSMVRLSIPPHL